jgi:hypothetical protein
MSIGGRKHQPQDDYDPGQPRAEGEPTDDYPDCGPNSRLSP